MKERVLRILEETTVFQKKEYNMSFADLDIFINECAGDSKEKYDALQFEINEHIQGRRPYDGLSREVKEILTDWENYEKDMREAGM